MVSPYKGKSPNAWLKITKRLLQKHPLNPELILDVAQIAWQSLWETRIGSGLAAIDLRQLAVPATVVGYFLEILFAHELERRFPNEWRGCRQGDDKDLVYIPDSSLSVEIKTSGQFGLKIFGNRSYGQKVTNITQVKKEKSGYYITVNFYKHSLLLIRFGWIDADDWMPQKSATGQMAGLRDIVYQSKLIPIAGDYRLKAPVRMLRGIGSKAEQELQVLGITTIGELIAFQGELPKSLQILRESLLKKGEF